MEKKLGLLTIFVLVFSISLASAVSWNVPSSVNLNQNFDVSFYGSGMYCIEANIPNNFLIITDISNGVRSNGVYKTCYASDFKITLRPTQSGTHTISGQYTSGEGIKDLNSKTIIVKEQQTTPTCPTCPSDSEWSNCENGKQIKMIYICSSSTNYQCVQTTETLDCQVEPIVDSDDNIVTCEVGWICKDENNLAYQSSDCSLSSIQECSRGCENKECKVKLEIKEDFPEDNLTITIIPPQEDTNSFFDKIGDLIKRIIDFLIFWD